MKNKMRSIPLFLLLLLLFSACSKDDEEFNLDLPPIPVLTIQTNWAIVKSNYLRLREEPSVVSESVALLRKGGVLEIISRTLEKEILEDEEGYWYQIDFDGLQGWVFGPYLGLYDTRQKADRAARELD